MIRLSQRFFVLISLLVVLLTSCAFPHYQHSYESSRGLNLREGKWLVNKIETNLTDYSKENLTKNLIKKFKELVRDSVVYIDSITLEERLLYQMTFELSPETLMALKYTTDFDFVLCIKGDKIRNEVSSIIINPEFTNDRNESEVYIDVYAVDIGQRIYSQRIVATISMNESDEKFQFSKSATGLVFGALKKGIKKIKKYSIRK